MAYIWDCGAAAPAAGGRAQSLLGRIGAVPHPFLHARIPHEVDTHPSALLHACTSLLHAVPFVTPLSAFDLRAARGWGRGGASEHERNQSTTTTALVVAPPLDFEPPDLRGGLVYASWSVTIHGGRFSLVER